MPLLPILLKLLPNIGLLSRLPRKTLVSITVGIIVIIGYNQIKTNAFQDGYDTATREMDGNYNMTLQARTEALREEYDKVVALEQEKNKIASAALQKLSEAPKEVKIHEVIKIVENDSCKSLSNDYIGLLNQHFGEEPK